MKSLLSIISNTTRRLRYLISGKLKLLICLIFIIFFGLLALPNISIKLGEQLISTPKLDFSLIDSNSTIGNFRRGRDIFNTYKVKAQVDFGLEDLSDEEKMSFLNSSLQTISRRMGLSGLYDVDLKAEKENNSYYLVFEYPEYYSNLVDITTLLTRKGKITFIDSSGQQELSLEDSDISSNLGIDYNSNLKSHLKFSFAQNSSTDLQIALGQQYFYMSIDDSLEYQLFQYEQTDPTTNTVRALPLATSVQSNLGLRDLYINITRSFFSETDPLENGFIVDQTVETIPTIFSSLSVRFISILSAIVFVALTIFTFIKFRIRKGIVFVIMSLTYLVFTVTVLKYISAPISLVFIIAYFLMSAIANIFIWNLINLESKAELKVVLKNLRYVGFILILLSLFTVRFIPGLGRFYDSLGVILVFGITFLLMSILNFKVLTEELILKSEKNG